MGSLDKRKLARLKRKKRIRKKISGTADTPRLCVTRSLRHIHAQIIDDTVGQTLVTASTCEKDMKSACIDKKKMEVATTVGKIIAERAIEKGITGIVFDRNGFLYHGRIKAVSEGAREGGLKF